jgi:hypothetical protein
LQIVDCRFFFKSAINNLKSKNYLIAPQGATYPSPPQRGGLDYIAPLGRWEFYCNKVEVKTDISLIYYKILLRCRRESGFSVA